MRRRVLFVDDDAQFRENLAEYLERRDYDVVRASDGREALDRLAGPGEQFDAIVLDLRMPNLGGEKVLGRLRETQRPVPPIMVQSAFFNRDAVGLCLECGVKCMFAKPCEPDDVERALDALIHGDDAKLWSLAGDANSSIRAVTSPTTVLFKLTRDLQEVLEAKDPLGSMVGKREASLRAFFLDRTNHPTPRSINAYEPVLVVARRWNSWYPSFFDAPGGCYALVGPRQASSPGPCAVIDPGFRCLDVLGGQGISVHDVGTCVVSHNHPDHVAGIFELMASRHALGLPTRGWCNATTVGMFGDCSGFGLEMDELSTAIESPLFSYDSASGGTRKVLITGFPTSHREIGRRSASLGLAISTRAGGQEEPKLIGRGIILGDTEYSRAQNQSFADRLTGGGVRFVVLHVGSVQEKQREGGHLYYPGLRRLLNDMEAALETKEWAGSKLPVLLSEWGLEHATRSQIRGICGRDLADFDDRSPILEIADQLNRDLQSICVLSADIGLTIGLETGQVHLPDGSMKRVEEVQAVLSGDGIEYRAR